jgi:predicted transcriptional regulator
MSVSLSTSSEARKRPSGIIVIAVLWVLTSLYVMYWGIDTILLDLSYDPNASELLELSTYAREWLGFGVPTDLMLCFCLVAVSVLIVFTAYGLYTAKSWSYKSALAIPVIATLVHGSTAIFYASAPAELGFSYDLPLHSALTLINLGWMFVTMTYLRKPDVRQYIVRVPLKPVLSMPHASHTSTPRLGAQEEKIVKAIVSAGSPLTWNEIHQATNLEEEPLNKALAKLFRAKAIQKISENGDMRYKVSYDLYKGYQTQLRLDSNIERRTELLKWINQWREARGLNFSLEHEHFFLEGRHLDDFSKELISHAKSDVLVVNPFIQHCDLSDTLIEVKKKGINVNVITRPPKDQYPDKLVRKQEYHQRLKDEGISLVYKEKVHAKLIVVDTVIAISSSMNFFPESSAGVSWEAGLVSIDQQVVDSIVSSPFSRLT